MENDYQLRAWIALIGWRAVLRERIERRSLDARPGVGRHDAGTVLPHDADDADTLLGIAPGATDVLLNALGAGLGDAADETGAMASPALPVLASDDGAVQSATATVRGAARPSVDAGIGRDGQIPSAPRDQSSEEVAPAIPASERPTSATRPAAALAREHAALVRIFLCRATVEAYAGLPASTQIMFWTRLIEGASWAEVATHAGTTEAGAKRRVQRAQRTLAGRVIARVRALPRGYAQVVTAYCARLGIELPDRSMAGHVRARSRRTVAENADQ